MRRPRLLLFIAVIAAIAYSAIMVFAHPTIFFDPPREAPYMDCVFNLSTGQCLTGNWTVNSSEIEANNFNSSGSWCGNRSYFGFDGSVDSVSYDVPGLQNLSNFTIVVGFTPQNVTKFAGIVSMFSEDLFGGGWTLRTLDDGYLQFRHVNSTNDTSHTFNDNNHTGLVNNENYTLVMTLDGLYMRAWLNNVQIERQALNYPITSNVSAKLRLGYYNSTSVNRFPGQIHFVYIYNYSVTPAQAANRTATICGSDPHPLNSTSFGIWPLSNTTGPNWTSDYSQDRLRDSYDYRTFSDHDSGIDFHRGIDLGNVSGLPEMAVMNGTVVRAETDEEVNGTGRRRFGNWVMIEHTPDPITGQPRHSLYFHMNDTPLVTEGDSVIAGQLIGLVGNTGYQINTKHLHFEMTQDLDEDLYSNRRAIHPFNGLNYSNINATNMSINANTTHYILSVTHNYTDMDLVSFKFVGTRANRTVNYQTKEGVNLSDADQHCYNDVCYEPEDATYPFGDYTVNYTVDRFITGPLIGAIIKDVKDWTEVYEITAWPLPNLTLRKVSVASANNNDFILYNISLNLTGDAAYNVTLTDTYPVSLRYNSSSLAPMAGTNGSFNIGNLSPNTVYRFNVTMQVLNVTNGTLANNSINISYYNFTGFSFVGNTSNATLLLNQEFSNATLSKLDTNDPIESNSFFTYQVRINVTNGTLFNATLYDNYSDTVHFRNATPSPTTGNTTFDLGNFSAGTVYQVNITVQVKNVSNGLVFNNTVNLSFANATGRVTTMNVTINTTVNNGPIYNTTNLTIDKSDGADPVNISTVLNYTINLTNTGTGTAHNITLNETYPPEVRFVSAVPSPISGTNTSFLIPNLTSGIVYSINISVLTLNTTGTINNTANVSFVNETGYLLNYSDTEQTVIENMVTAESSPGGSSGGGGGGGSSGYVPPVARPLCVENWFCSDWTTCTGEQSRECLDLNGCGTVKSKPDDLQACTVEVKEEPARVFAPFTLTFAPRQFFYAGKALILTFLMVMSIIVLHSPGLFTFARDPLGAYVRQARANGLKDNAIRLKLKKAGWKEYAIEEKLK